MMRPPSRFVKNFTALGLVQATNYVLPLITLPYLVRCLGIEAFGKLSFVQAIILYLMLISDYSFNITATQQISLHRAEPEAIRRIVRNVYSSKVYLIGVCLVVLILLAAIGDRQMAFLYAGGFLFLLGQTLFPVWFFQGIENMKYITFLNLLSKAVYTLLIFFLIREPGDIIWILPIQGSGSLIASGMAIMIIWKRFCVNFRIVSFREVLSVLRDGLHLFVSNISISMYVNSNIVILGIFGNELVTGYYSVAEKVLILLRQVFVIFSQAIFPKFVALAGTGLGQLRVFLKQTYVPFAVVMLSGCVCVFIFAGKLTFLLTGAHNLYITQLMRILIFIPVALTLQVPSYQLLLSLNKRKEIMYSFVIIAVVSILNNVLLTYLFSAMGSAVSMLLSEIMISLLLIFLSRPILRQYTMRST